MVQLRVKDNWRYKKEDMSAITSLVDKVADKTLEQLDHDGIFVFPELVKDAEDLTKDQMIIQSINDCYCLGNVMGFLGYGKERLVIESRFSGQNNDYFFQYLLDKVMDYPNIVDLKANADQNARMFNLLLFLFPVYLQKALRKGVFKKYLRKSYNDENVKGHIDIARHIGNNIPFTGRVAYNQREFSYDNYLMELVRHTIEFIKRKPYGNRLLFGVKDEVKQVVNATPDYKPHDRQKIIEKNKQYTVRHAYYREYRALQHLCILILLNQKHQIGNGSRQVYGILFDGAWLWEEYIHTLVGDYFFHPKNKMRTGKQYLFDHGRGEIYPDFIGKEKGARIIADAKYKPAGNIRSQDYMQVLTYMFRFNSKRGYYFYPESEEMDDIILWLNKGTSYESNVSPRDDICIIKHGLKIAVNAENYQKYVEIMHNYEQEFIETLMKEMSLHDDK